MSVQLTGGYDQLMGSWLSTQVKKITIPGVIKAALPAAAPSPVPVLPSRSAFPAWLPWAAGGVVAAGVGVLLLRKRRQ